MATVLLSACTAGAPPLAPSAQVARQDAGGVTVYVVYNHFHSGLTVPRASIVAAPGPTAEALRVLHPQPWTSLGYGDAKFYEQRGINAGRVLDFFRSMLAPGNPSVVHLEGVDDPLKDASRPTILRLTISRARLPDLIARVDASFALHDGKPEFLTPARTPTTPSSAASAPRPLSTSATSGSAKCWAQPAFRIIPCWTPPPTGLAWTCGRAAMRCWPSVADRRSGHSPASAAGMKRAASEEAAPIS